MSDLKLKSTRSHHHPHTPDWVYDIKYLTFSGGGVRGFAFAGAVLTLDEAFRKRNKNLYKQLKGCSGCSVGALFALWTVLGVRGQQLFREVLYTDIGHVMEDLSIDNLMEMYGLNNTLRIRQQIFDILERHTGLGDITFKKLHDMTGKHYVCSLTNVSSGKVEYHSYLTTPNNKVMDSVVASMSIPMLFAPTIINGDYYVDGGVLDNLPFSVFPPEESLIFALGGNLPDITDVKSFIFRIAMLGLASSDLARVNSLPTELRNRVLTLRVTDISPISFHIDYETKRRVMVMGTKIVGRFLYPQLLLQDCMKMLTRVLFTISNQKVKKEMEKKDQEEKEEEEEGPGPNPETDSKDETSSPSPSTPTSNPRTPTPSPILSKTPPEHSVDDSSSDKPESKESQ
jgi:predicted acylesterase/phospholipase RssA